MKKSSHALKYKLEITRTGQTVINTFKAVGNKPPNARQYEQYDLAY